MYFAVDCSMRKMLFVEKSEHYYKLDNWPPDSERRSIEHYVMFIVHM